MSSYGLTELRVGMRAEFTATIPAASIDDFIRISGDSNPLHADPAYARAAGYPGRVAHGLLTASLYSRLVGLHLPGEKALLHRLDASFLKPVHAGDELRVTGEITAVNESVAQIELKAEIHRAGEKISRARIWVGVRG